MNPLGIVIADDHSLFRQGLIRILQEWPEFKVIGEAQDGLELLDLIRGDGLAPEIILLDISMPRLRGIETIQEIKLLLPRVKVLILTMHKDKEYLAEAMAAGADGYLLKDEAVEGLFQALDAIRRNGFFVSPFFKNELIDDWLQMVRGEKPSLPGPAILTTRERQILKLIAEGKSNKEIAALLFISVRTVDHHRASLMEKLSLKGTAELVKYALRKGFV
jgi:DNA-binding NarL/FixJ family response regulator